MAIEGARMTYDPDNHQVVLYGGHRYVSTDTTLSMPMPLTWRHGEGTWTPICTVSPPVGRYLPAFAYDPRNHLYVMAGGALGVDNVQERFSQLSDEVWTCDGDTWSLSTGHLPAGRTGAQMVFDTGRGALVLAGGVDDMGVEVGSTLTSSDGGATWTVLTTTPFRTGSQGAALAYDDLGQRVLALEGITTPPSVDAQPYDRLWELESGGSTWGTLCDNCSGIFRRDASLVHVPGTRETYLLNGYAGGVQELPGTWVLEQNRWLEISEQLPKRDSVAVVYDPDRDEIIAYGGNGQSCDGVHGGCPETWVMSN